MTRQDKINKAILDAQKAMLGFLPKLKEQARRLKLYKTAYALEEAVKAAEIEVANKAFKLTRKRS